MYHNETLWFDQFEFRPIYCQVVDVRKHAFMHSSSNCINAIKLSQIEFWSAWSMLFIAELCNRWCLFPCLPANCGERCFVAAQACLYKTRFELLSSLPYKCWTFYALIREVKPRINVVKVALKLYASVQTGRNKHNYNISKAQKQKTERTKRKQLLPYQLASIKQNGKKNMRKVSRN